MSDRESVPDELAALFEAERSAPVGDSRAREQVRLRLAAIAPIVPAKAAAGAATSALLSGTGKIIAIVAITVSVGATVVAISKGTTHSSPPTAPVTLAVAEHVDPEPVRDHAVQPDEVAGERESPAPVMTVQGDAPPVSAEASPSEAKLIKLALSALSSGDAQRALDLTNDAERLHPNGVLIEEREALRVRAFSKLGQVAEAETAAKKFLSQFPRSVHRASVERAMKAEKP